MLMALAGKRTATACPSSSQIIKYKAYFKEGSGLYGTQTTVSIDGSSATVPVMFHTLAMDFKDQNGDLNRQPASAPGMNESISTRRVQS